MTVNHEECTKTSFRVSLALHGRVKELAYIEKRTVDSIIAEALDNLL
jgi:predicted transcriptional regulator